MRKLVEMLLDFIEESEGLWITNNTDIEGDQWDINISHDVDGKSIYIMYSDCDWRIYYGDIKSITFQDFIDMIIVTLKVKNKKTLLIHILQKEE